MLESYTKEAVELIAKTAEEKGKYADNPRRIVENAMDFFLIPPVDLDPYGILRKLEHLLDKAEDRFEDIASRIAPNSDAVWRANTISLLKGGIGLNTIAKMVRHYVEFTKKTGNLQLAMLLQMNMPIIKKIAKAQLEGVRAISEGRAIGDGAGPLVAAHLMQGERIISGVAKDIVACETRLVGREVIVLKANGPGATLGKLGDAVKKLCENGKVAKIITVDASLKLEGEKTGKVCEGLGAAIGDPGPEKAKIEEAALGLNIPIEAYAIKMSIEEAISPMTKEIGEAVPKAIELIKESVARTAQNGKILIVGVGNTCGVGNSYDSVKELKLPEKEKEKEELGALDKLFKALVKPPGKGEKKATEKKTR